MDDDNRTRVRRHNLGFVYQYHHLLPELSALENIAVPQIIAGKSKKISRCRAREMLEWRGLSERSTHRPARLSGGEQQRIAIARALLNDPKLIIADEPTGNLDPQTSKEIMELFKSLHQKGMTLLMATHDYQMIIKFPGKIFKCEEGKVFEVIAKS